MLENKVLAKIPFMSDGVQSNKLQIANTRSYKFLILFVVAAFFMFGFNIQEGFSQNRVEISGTVTDASDGNSLPGVNIIVPGTTIGTTSGGDGTYSLNVPADADSLQFSFVGYVPVTVAIQGRTTIDVSLSPDVQLLEDVVVVGYGTQDKKQVTGSISSVKEEDFVQGNINNASQLVQGKVAGLTVATQGGDPNSDPTLRLRGISSFGANQDPLVVVDGIIGASLNNIDPNDIASIDVLKDASASAIYGTRGSAGVILITTKSGSGTVREGSGVSVSYNGYVTLDGIENKLNVLSGEEFRAFANDLGATVNDLGSSVDYFDEVSQTGINNVHNLALSGGDANTTFRLSGNFRDREGIQVKTGFQQINGRLNLTQSTLDDRLSFTVNLGVTNRESDFGFGEVFRYAATFNPTAPVRSSGFENTGGFTEIGSFDIFNPVALTETAENFGERKNFTGSLKVDYEFENLVPGLSASAFYSLETISNFTSEFYQKTNKFRGTATQSSLGEGLARKNAEDLQSELFEVTANYITDIDQLNLEILGGYSFNDFVDEGSFIEAGDFISDAVGPNNFTFAQEVADGEATVTSFKNTHRIIGGFGRVAANWDNTYFLNGSYRREGSSRFGDDNKWGNFWALGGGVEVTNLVDIPEIDRLKVRASFGRTGQDAPFDGISQLRFGPGGSFFDGTQFIQSFRPVSNPNPDLQWEEKSEFNVGIDFETLNSRLSGSLEYYTQTIDNLLFPVEVAVPPNIFPTTWQNIGELDSQGFEATLDYAAIRKNTFNWNTSLTASFFGETTLENFVSGTRFISNAGAPGLNQTEFIRIGEGEPIGQIWGPKFSRVGTSSDDLDADGNPDTGSFVCVDPSGSEFLCRNTSRDREQVLGNGLPDFQFGWTNTLNYKNFDFNVFVRGVFGHQMVNTYRLFYEPPGQLGNFNVLESSRDIADITESQVYSSFFVENADFVRIENVSIGYNVPTNNMQYLKRLRVYFTVNNLFTITGYDGVDPDVNYFDPGPNDNGQRNAGFGPTVIGGEAGGALAPGIERRNEWFTIRSFTLGLKLDL